MATRAKSPSKRSPTKKSPSKKSASKKSPTLLGQPTRKAPSHPVAVNVKKSFEDVQQELFDLYNNKVAAKRALKSDLRDLNLALEVLPADMHALVMERYLEYQKGERRRTPGAMPVFKTPKASSK